MIQNKVNITLSKKCAFIKYCDGHMFMCKNITLEQLFRKQILTM